MRRALAAKVLVGGLICLWSVAAGSFAMAQTKAGGEAKTPEQAVRKVCTGCHGLEIVMDTPKDYDAWHDTVQTMIDRGASGTQDEYQLVMDFLFANMTTIDVNHADSETLGTVLHAGPAQVAAIMARRKDRPFKNLTDLLASVPGLNKSILEAKKRMIFFQ